MVYCWALHTFTENSIQSKFCSVIMPKSMETFSICFSEYLLPMISSRSQKMSKKAGFKFSITWLKMEFLSPSMFIAHTENAMQFGSVLDLGPVLSSKSFSSTRRKIFVAYMVKSINRVQLMLFIKLWTTESPTADWPMWNYCSNMALTQTVYLKA